MSVHAKEGRWVVRWRQEDRQRSRSFQTKRDAVDFDRAIRADERRARDGELAGDLLDRARALAGDDPDRLRGLAAQARSLADEAGRRADELDPVMSLRKNRVGSWEVRYIDAGGSKRSKSFRLKRDAERFDLQVKDARQTGTLIRLDGGAETLDAYVEQVWVPVHVEPLAPKTATRYAQLYDGHLSPMLGGYELRQLTSEVIGRWQADRLRAGAPVEWTRKALTLLGGILQRALEAGRIQSNPQRLVRKAAPAPTAEVRPFAPETVERIILALRAGAGRDAPSTRRDVRELRERDAVLVALLAYAGLRPQEMRALQWGHVGERTLTIHAPKTRRHSTAPRSVRLLTPLAQDLREWRLASGRPSADAPVIPALDDGEWTEAAFELWRGRAWTAALKAAGIPYQRPYDLRHSFASLLLHEGRSVIYVARQLGHSATLTMKTYGHVIEELDDAPRISAEDAIGAARASAAVGRSGRL